MVSWLGETLNNAILGCFRTGVLTTTPLPDSHRTAYVYLSRDILCELPPRVRNTCTPRTENRFPLDLDPSGKIAF